MKVVFKFSSSHHRWQVKLMIVCLCKGISDKHIRQAIDRGATTVQDVADDCGAGAGCGTCHGMIEMMLGDDGTLTSIDLARAAARVAAAPTCADCPRRAAAAGITSPSQKLGEAA
jgi:bacterioferritin-associated ferredoxin